MFVAAGAIVGAGIYANCIPPDAAGTPPKRPAGVPPQAVWVGGLDGGAFIHCVVHARRNANHCEVYNDFTGGLAVKADFRLRGENRAAETPELLYRSWTGVVINLRNQLTLEKAVDGL